MWKIADPSRFQPVRRQKSQELGLLPRIRDRRGDLPPQVEDQALRLGGFLLGIDGQEIAVLPERQKPRLVGRALADGRVLAVEVVGEDAEGVLGRAHVEGVHDDVGLAVLMEAAGHEERHVVGAIDLPRAVDVVEDRPRVEDLIGLGQPGTGRDRDVGRQPAGVGDGRFDSSGRVLPTRPGRQERRASSFGPIVPCPSGEDKETNRPSPAFAKYGNSGNNSPEGETYV